METINLENGFLKENQAKIQETIVALTAEKSALEDKLLETSESIIIAKEKESQIAELEANLSSLTQVHEEFQRRSETLSRKYDAELKKMRAENVQLKEKGLQAEEAKL